MWLREFFSVLNEYPITAIIVAGFIITVLGIVFNKEKS